MTHDFSMISKTLSQFRSSSVSGRPRIDPKFYHSQFLSPHIVFLPLSHFFFTSTGYFILLLLRFDHILSLLSMHSNRHNLIRRNGLLRALQQFPITLCSTLLETQSILGIQRRWSVFLL